MLTFGLLFTVAYLAVFGSLGLISAFTTPWVKMSTRLFDFAMGAAGVLCSALILSLVVA